MRTKRIEKMKKLLLGLLLLVAAGIVALAFFKIPSPSVEVRKQIDLS
jgi:hypothetical protein